MLAVNPSGAGTPYIRSIVLLGRRSSMCVHMQKPFEPRQVRFIASVAS